MNESERDFLQDIAKQLRITGLKMVREAGSGHIGGAFSLSEILSVLYFSKMDIDPQNPGYKNRDRLVMSKGHATVALYPALAHRGFCSLERLKTFRKAEHDLSGHVEMLHVEGVDMSTGSLGQGLSVAVGMASASRLLKKSNFVYAICGDGEIQEGQIWEALMYSGSKKLDNLIVILDCNKVQLDGTTKDVLDTGDLDMKFKAFGFHVQSIDGHNVEEISQAIDLAKSTKGQPHMIIANTIKGKGVSYMEGKNVWHGKHPSKEQFEAAFAELGEG